MFFAKRKLKRIKKQLESEYEERLKANDEENKRIVRDIQENCDRKAQKLRENVMELSEKLEEATQKSQEDKILINQYRERLKEYEQPMDINPDNPDAVPPILHPSFQHLLPKIVAFLDPWSFVRFISCAKILFYLAQQGLLRTTVLMCCTSIPIYRMRTRRGVVPILSWKDKHIGYEDFSQICQSPWIRIQMDELTLEDIDVQNAGLFEARLLELLATLGIKTINQVRLCGNVTFQRLWQEIKVRKLIVYDAHSIEFLEQCHQIEDVCLMLVVRRGVEEAQKAIVKFLNSASTSKLFVHGIYLPPTLLDTLIMEWMNGNRIINLISVDIDFTNFSLVFREVLRVKKTWKCQADLKRAPRNWCRNVMRERGAEVLCGRGIIYIFKRWDGQLLRAQICLFTVVLAKM